MKYKKKERAKKMFYIVGSFAVTIGAMLAIPKVVEFLSDKMYKPTLSQKDDDWGPVIVKREKTKED